MLHRLQVHLYVYPNFDEARVDNFYAFFEHRTCAIAANVDMYIYNSLQACAHTTCYAICCFGLGPGSGGLFRGDVREVVRDGGHSVLSDNDNCKVERVSLAFST